MRVRKFAASLALLLFVLVALPRAGALLGALFPGTVPPIYPYASFFRLALRQLLLVGVAVGAASVIGVVVATLTTRGPGRMFRPLAASIAAVGQTFPPVAVLALAVPVLGYGRDPALLALFLYAVLPVLANSLAGFDLVPEALRDAADGLGFTPLGRLRAVEFPLAAPLILAGIRTAAIIDIGTASIASTVGVKTLGAPILDGLVAEKTGYVLEGALVAALLAIAVDLAFEAAAPSGAGTTRPGLSRGREH